MLSRRLQSKPKTGLRAGATTVEMAFCLPILFLLFLGSIDLIRYNLLRNVVTQATYEAARAGSVKGATIADVQNTVELELQRFGVDLDYTLTTVPATLPSSTSDTLTVTIVSNIRSAGWILSNYIMGDTMTESMTIKLE